MTGENARLLLAIFDATAGLLIAYALMSRTLLAIPKPHRFFVSLGAAGLLAQSVLIMARLNGFAVAELWWTWAAKDICIGGIALTYGVMAIRRKKA